MIATISARKEMQVSRMRSAMERVERLLSAYARKHGGRFVVFGSVARDTVRHDSDLDLLIDFPPEIERRARSYAESVCAEHGIRPDLVLLPDASPRLMERIRRDGRPVS